MWGWGWGVRSPASARTLVLCLWLLLACVCALPESNIETLINSRVRAGVTGARIASDGCVFASLGNIDVRLQVSFTANDTILYGSPRSSSTFNYVQQTELLSLGALEMRTVIFFSLVPQGPCEGILPLGPLSVIWGMFNSSITFAGNYMYPGMPPPPSAVLTTYVTMEGEGGNRTIAFNLYQLNSKIPSPVYASARLPHIIYPWHLVLPLGEYETNTEDARVILGRQFLQMGVVTVKRPALTFASVLSPTSDMDLWIEPLPCLVVADQSMLVMRFLALCVFIMLVAWVFNEAGDWQALERSGRQSECDSGTDFFPSQWVGWREEHLINRAGLEWPLTWLFLFGLILAGVATTAFKDNRIFCMLSALTWSRSTNPWLPVDISGVFTLLIVLHAPLLSLACVALPMLANRMPVRPGHHCLIPVSQLGFLVAWMLSVPAESDPLALFFFVIVTLFWNWSVLWDGLVVLSYTDRYWLLGIPLMADAVLLSACSAVVVYTPLFTYHGPVDTDTYIIWITLCLAATLSPPLLLRISTTRTLGIRVP